MVIAVGDNHGGSETDDGYTVRSHHSTLESFQSQHLRGRLFPEAQSAPKAFQVKQLRGHVYSVIRMKWAALHVRFCQVPGHIHHALMASCKYVVNCAFVSCQDGRTLPSSKPCQVICDICPLSVCMCGQVRAGCGRKRFPGVCARISGVFALLGRVKMELFQSGKPAVNCRCRPA